MNFIIGGLVLCSVIINEPFLEKEKEKVEDVYIQGKIISIVEDEIYIRSGQGVIKEKEYTLIIKTENFDKIVVAGKSCRSLVSKEEDKQDEQVQKITKVPKSNKLKNIEDSEEEILFIPVSQDELSEIDASEIKYIKIKDLREKSTIKLYPTLEKAQADSKIVKKEVVKAPKIVKEVIKLEPKIVKKEVVKAPKIVKEAVAVKDVFNKLEANLGNPPKQKKITKVIEEDQTSLIDSFINLFMGD